MQRIYLSPDRPRWAPTTEQDLRLAVDDGLLTESHYLEAKRELEPGKAKNREHARDLASFAVDGGTIIVGLDENKTNGTFMVAPQPLDGLRERVEAIARTIPDPPLDVITEAVASEADASTGYLVIHVPPSAVAPHMVDGRYLGRGAPGSGPSPMRRSSGSMRGGGAPSWMRQPCSTSSSLETRCRQRLASRRTSSCSQSRWRAGRTCSCRS